MLELTLLPGEEISEGTLAVVHGIGRAAVRAALIRLAHDRLVEVVPRRCYVVAPITFKRTADVFGFRMVLEPAAARLAADHATDDQIAELCSLNAACVRPDSQDTLGAQRQANNRFHLALAQTVGNDRLTENVSGLLDELEQVLYLPQLSHVRDRVIAIPDEHGAVVDAIATRDGERAGNAMTSHIEPNMCSVSRVLIDTSEIAPINLAGNGR